MYDMSVQKRFGKADLTTSTASDGEQWTENRSLGFPRKAPNPYIDIILHFSQCVQIIFDQLKGEYVRSPAYAKQVKPLQKPTLNPKYR